jgi:hypothetical protein
VRHLPPPGIEVGECQYFVPGQAPNGGTTLRRVSPVSNANLGQGCEPELNTFLQLLRERKSILPAPADRKRPDSDRRAGGRRRRKHHRSLFEKFDQHPLRVKIRAALGTLVMGAPGGAAFAYLFFATAVTADDWGTASRLGIAAGGIAALIVTAFLTLTGGGMIAGPNEWLDRMLHRLKWPFCAIVFAVIGYVAVVIALGILRGRA